MALGFNPTPNLSIMQVRMRHWVYSYGARDAPTKLPSCPVPLGSCVLREWCRSWENLPTDWGVKWHGCWRTKGRRCGHSTGSAWCVTMHATKTINGWRRVSEKRIVCEAVRRRVYDLAWCTGSCVALNSVGALTPLSTTCPCNFQHHQQHHVFSSIESNTHFSQMSHI